MAVAQGSVSGLAREHVCSGELNRAACLHSRPSLCCGKTLIRPYFRLAYIDECAFIETRRDAERFEHGPFVLVSRASFNSYNNEEGNPAGRNR